MLMGLFKRAIVKILRQIGFEIVRYQDFISQPVVLACSSYCVKFVSVSLDGSKYFVPSYAINRPVSQAILHGVRYELETHKLIKHIYQDTKGDLIHAGTFFGDMLPSFSESVSGNVYCFEPVLENYILARMLILNNNLTNVVLFNAALSTSVENIRISTIAENGIHNGGASRISEKGEIVPSVCIDILDFENLACIQLDVEGHELHALQGANKTIKKHAPIILIEDNLNNCDEFLIERSYTIFGKIPGLTIWASGQRRYLLNGFKTGKY